MNATNPAQEPWLRGPIPWLIRFCLEKKLVVLLLAAALVGGGMHVAPFAWDDLPIPRNPVPVDAIPDIGENQQIVFTQWMGRSPQDVDDQVTYPLTVALLGLPGVKTVRSTSSFGFSSIYVIFEEDIEFYWSRSRVLEKLSSLPAGTLPPGVQPALGPDATALGQIYWYTLEGRDPEGRVTGGWGLDELRSIQDWTVRYALLSASGIAEVASVGGFVREVQVDVDPDAMRAHGVRLDQVIAAVRGSNLDVGARTVEINQVEYVVRGVGFLTSVEDLEQVVLHSRDNVPIRVRDVARVTVGPALRRGLLDKGGAEVVGGVAVVRYGENPLAAIDHLKDRIATVSPGLPRKVLVDWERVSREDLEAFAFAEGFAAWRGGELDQEAWVGWASRNQERHPAWLTLSQVTIVPFYDRTGLIQETLGTLEDALVEEILACIIVVLAMVLHMRSSVLISGLLPLAVLFSFIAMKLCAVDANVVALSGIAVAIGTMVDMGIILCENILRHLDEDPAEMPLLEVIHRASSEVGGALIAAVATTIISFLPVFALEAAEGKLFRPLAFTKTFALLGAALVAIVLIPPAAHLLFSRRGESRGWRSWVLPAALTALGLVALPLHPLGGLVVLVFAVNQALEDRLAEEAARRLRWGSNGLAILLVGWILSQHWSPLGQGAGAVRNFIFTAGLIGGVLGGFGVFLRFYSRLLRWCLDHKKTFLLLPAGLLVWGGIGWNSLGEEFMPPLDEGSYLYMPTTMPHASIGEALDALQKLDQALGSVPEVEQVVGKIGRAETSLDPAPLSMVETVVNYKPEYKVDRHGRVLTFAWDPETGEHLRDEAGELIPDAGGQPFRQWREHIRSAADIWDELVAVAQLPGTTSAPRLQPIAARIVMLQSGMRAPMGVKIQGPDLDTIQRTALDIERLLKEVPGVQKEAVVADRVVGKPYLEIDIDRQAIARHGLRIAQVQDVIEVAIGGKPLTTTVEGRERYPVRVRYARELRDSVEALERILVPAPDGSQVPLVQLAELRYVRGPQAIKSEDTFLTAYVLFDKLKEHAEVDVVEACEAFLKSKWESGELVLPDGVKYEFAGSYQNQVRSERRLRILVPIVLAIMIVILYFQFDSLLTTGIVFSSVLVAWAGGFIMLWLYAQPWFLDVDVLGTNLRVLFGVQPINLSVAVWVGFIALYGLADDDGVIMATYLDQSFARSSPGTIAAIREATVVAGERRIRPCLMTTATTALALVPVLTSTGRGSDIMVPMAIPSFGGMTIALITLFVVPTLYCGLAELRLAASRLATEAGPGAS